MSEDVVRDLAAIDAAIAGEPVDPDLADLAELAVTVRDQRPRPDAGVRARLDARAAEGFARRPAASGRSARRRALIPALGVAGSLALVTMVVVLGGGGDGAGPAQPVAGTGESAPLDLGTMQRAPRSGGSATTDTSAKAVAPNSEAAPAVQAPATAGAPTRSVERGATLNLVTTPARLDDVASGVVRTTDTLHGYVVSSSVESHGGTGGSATFDLRVPSARLQTALARLSDLASVRSRTESSLDITGSVVAARDRVDALTAERRGVLRQLAAATTAAATARARERLHVLDVRLARAQAARTALRRRTAYSTIGVEVATQRPSAGAGTGGGTWTPGDALHDALRVLSVAFGAALVAFAALLPLGLLAATGWGAWRVTAARRRSGALDAAR